jgi:transcription antitermination factor NusG
MSDNDDRQASLSWYALRVRAKSERSVALALDSKGYEHFLPLYRVATKRSDRIKQLELPLFPGYLFCRLNFLERVLPVLTIPGVHSIVGAGKQPIPISDREIDDVQTVVRSGLAAQPCTHVTVGSKLIIERGPLAGLEGIAVDVARGCRFIVSVSLLQRSVCIEIDQSWARPTGQLKPPPYNADALSVQAPSWNRNVQPGSLQPGSTKRT